MSFDFYFFIFRSSKLLPVNIPSLFLSCPPVCPIYSSLQPPQIMYKVGSFIDEVWFQDKWLVPILEFKEFTLYNIIATKQFFPYFVVLKVGLFVKKFEEHKILPKFGACLLQSINLFSTVFVMRMSRKRSLLPLNSIEKIKFQHL